MCGKPAESVSFTTGTGLFWKKLAGRVSDLISVLRNTLAGSKTVVSMSRNATASAALGFCGGRRRGRDGVPCRGRGSGAKAGEPTAERARRKRTSSQKNQLYSQPTSNMTMFIHGCRPTLRVGIQLQGNARAMPLSHSSHPSQCAPPKNNPKKLPRNSVDARFPFRNSSPPCR